jgi:hypothetical protein
LWVKGHDSKKCESILAPRATWVVVSIVNVKLRQISPMATCHTTHHGASTSLNYTRNVVVEG